jgi:hypothetical protein
MNKTIDVYMKEGNQEKFDNMGNHKLKVCEDYIDHNDNSIVLSDGCSAAKYSDFGSRLLVQNTLLQLKLFDDYNNHDTIKVSLDTLANLQIDKTALFSTLSIIHSRNKVTDIEIYNDGFCIIKHENEIYVYRIYYQENWPYYLLYTQSDLQYTKLNNTKIVELAVLDENFEINSFDKFEYDYTHIFKYRLFNTSNIKYVLIASDGIEQFKRKNEYIPYIDIIKEICGFKSLAGEFLKRRMKTLMKDYEKEGIYPADDVSIGGICFDEK